MVRSRLWQQPGVPASIRRHEMPSGVRQNTL